MNIPVIYEFNGLLGKGSFGEVYRVKKLDADKEIALKIKRYNNRDYHKEKAIINALNSTDQFDYPDSLIKIYNIHFQAYRATISTFIEMELFEGKSLGDLYQKRDDIIKADPKVVKMYLIVLFGTLQFLHKNYIYHRDIKPDNILYKDGRILLIDFDLACLKDKESVARCTDGIHGSLLYMDPATMNVRNSNYEKGDIYSLAFTFITLMVGYVEHFDARQDPTAERSKREIIDLFEDETVPRDLKFLLMRCTLSDPNFRPTAEDARSDLVLSDFSTLTL